MALSEAYRQPGTIQEKKKKKRRRGRADNILFSMASRSPSAVTPFPKPSSVPDTPYGEASSSPSPQPVPFPSPQTFDIIPPLHGLLLRLISPQTTGEAALSGARPPPAAGAASSAAPPHSQSQLQPPSATDNHASSNAEVGAVGPNAPPPLDIKDLPIETNSIRIRIQKARAVVESLPDVHRTVADQEREIEELEDRIARLRSVIVEFGKRAGKQTEAS